MSRPSFPCCGVFLIGLFSALCAGQEWTRFRGPNGTGLGVGSGIPVIPDDHAWAWKIALPGTGHSSPVLWGGRLFVTCCDQDTATRTVLCINGTDGKVLWQKEFTSRTYRQHADNSYASSTPAVDGRHVYVAWTTPDEYALLALTHEGKEVWRVNLGRFTSQHGSGVSPVVFEDLVILTNEQEGTPSFVAAYDCGTGELRWKTARRSTHMAASTPCVYQPANQGPQLILTSRTEGVTALDPRTGKLLWQVGDAFAFRVIASPVVAGNVVIGNCGEGPSGKGLVAVRPPGGPGEKPAVAWKMMANAPYVPSPLAKGELLFTLSDTGTVSCLRSATGQVVWQQRIGGAYFASPIAIGDRLYCISKKGEMVVLSATETYELLGRIDLGEQCFATPAVANGRLYIRTLSHLICVGGR